MSCWQKKMAICVVSLPLIRRVLISCASLLPPSTAVSMIAVLYGDMHFFCVCSSSPRSRTQMLLRHITQKPKRP